MAAHEWRQPLGALQFRRQPVASTRSGSGRAQHYHRQRVERNLQHLVELTRKVEIIARLQTTADSPVAAGSVREHGRASGASASRDGRRARRDDSRPRRFAGADRGRQPARDGVRQPAVERDQMLGSRKPDRYVEVSSQIDGDGWCRIEVRDNGVGIPPHALTTIFQRASPARMPIARICRTSPALASVWPSWTTACGDGRTRRRALSRARGHDLHVDPPADPVRQNRLRSCRCRTGRRSTAPGTTLARARCALSGLAERARPWSSVLCPGSVLGPAGPWSASSVLRPASLRPERHGCGPMDPGPGTDKAEERRTKDARYTDSKARQPFTASGDSRFTARPEITVQFGKSLVDAVERDCDRESSTCSN